MAVSEIEAGVRRAELATMSAEQLLEEARRAGLSVTTEAGKLLVRGRRDADQILVQTLLERKADLMALLAEPGDESLSGPAQAATDVASDRAPASVEELEAILTEVEAEVRRLTADTKLLQAARNLLEDCRQIWREGRAEVALALARDYTVRIPAYLIERACPVRKPR